MAVCVLAVLLSNGAAWMLKTWNHLTMDELLYQLNASAQGTNEEMIRDGIEYCLPAAVLTLLLLLAVVIVYWKRKKIYHIIMWSCVVLSLLLFGSAVKTVWDSLEVETYVENKNESSDFVGNHYVDARNVEITFPEEKRNLIYIFLESMEISYSDIENGGGFEENYIPELTALAQEYEDFSGAETKLSGARMMPNTSWTIAGMFAQTAGLPLDIPIQGLNMDTQDTFFPGIITLGDILDEAGYSQTLFIGSEAAFAGRELYFTEHGNYQIKDYTYAIEQGRIPSDYKVWWGYEDKKLFEYAKEELLELAQQEEPFNFTMLTADTHFEDGYVCEDCGDTFGDNRYANVIACSSARVYDFVRWIQEQDFYENTTIVISGDHLTMDSDFCNDVTGGYLRKVYTTYINSGAQVEMPDMTRGYTVFDQYPTTLASLGVLIEGNRLGLGTNLFSSVSTLSEEYGEDMMISELNKDSEFMNELALTIDLEDEELLKREGKLLTADVLVGEYDYTTGYLPVTVSNIQNAENGVSSVHVAVWTEEDQSDLQWLTADLREDGNYYVDVNVVSFGYKTGEYHIDIYLVDQDGEQQILVSTTGYVE